MRSRLILLFVVLALALTSMGYLVRTWSVQHEVRDHDDALLHRSAAAIAAAIDERVAAGGSVDEAYLGRLVGPDLAVRFHPADGPDVDVRGEGFAGSLSPGDGKENPWAEAGTADDGYVLLSEDASVVHDTAWQSLPVMLLLLLLTALVAAIAGALFARWYERPFRRLAEAAAALGRGRFQLDLPRSRIREANAIAQALDASARQLQDRLATEDEFAQRASHALRTPLTGLRLELEEAALHEDMPAEAGAALQRSLQRVDQLDAVTGELVSLARRRALVAEATIALELLARQITQRWADELGARGRALSAAVEGDGATTYTPGPVEQILESLIIDVVHRSAGAVRLVFVAGADGHLRITVAAERAVEVRKVGTAPLLRARTVALALGGRLEGEYAAGGVEIVLPRR
jgi:signal transduction histidine kinase